MGKIVIDNCRISGTSFGSIRNYDEISITNTEMDFEEDGINISMSDNVAIESFVKSKSSEELNEIIKKLKFFERDDKKLLVLESNGLNVLEMSSNISSIISMFMQMTQFLG